jgi:hypothetical protein
MILLSIVTPRNYRRNGYAGQMLREITAKFSTYEIELCVEPIDDKPLDSAALHRWYARAGFRQRRGEMDGILYRRPDVAFVSSKC